MTALHLPEENRCLDILELIEHTDLLRSASHLLLPLHFFRFNQVVNDLFRFAAEFFRFSVFCLTWRSKAWHCLVVWPHMAFRPLVIRSDTGGRTRASGVTIILALPRQHSLITVLIPVHNSGHFGPPLPFWAPGPPGIAGATDG